MRVRGKRKIHSGIQLVRNGKSKSNNQLERILRCEYAPRYRSSRNGRYQRGDAPAGGAGPSAERPEERVMPATRPPQDDMSSFFSLKLDAAVGGERYLCAVFLANVNNQKL